MAALGWQQCLHISSMLPGAAAAVGTVGPLESLPLTTGSNLLVNI